MTKPNIIFVFADQLRYDALGCTGNRIVKTPNIDRLAREGMLFDHALSAHPICGPYRAQLLTGCYSHRTKVICNEYKLDERLPTLPMALREEGYRTAYVGKLHLGQGPYPDETSRLGFEDMIAYHSGHHYYNTTYFHNGEGPFVMEDYAPREETRLAIETLERYRTETPDAPFCLVMTWGPPHWSGNKGKEGEYGNYPEEYDMYDPDGIPIAENVPPMLRDYEKKEFADYYAMVSSLDDCMGRLMQKLEEWNLIEDTILCFSSDHGDHMGAHGYGKPLTHWLPWSMRGSKMTPYEESVHVPMMVRYPRKVSPGQRSQAIFNSVDIMPTLLGLSGVACPDSVQGNDLSPVLRGEPVEMPSSAYLQNTGSGWPTIRTMAGGLWRGVRTDRYTYARYAFPEKRRVLFDRREDPLEMTNLAENLEYAAVTEELEEVLQEWILRTEDPFDTGTRNPDTGMLELGQTFLEDRWSRKPFME